MDCGPASDPGHGLAHEVASQLRAHRPQLLAAPLLLGFGVTVVHEGCHALAVLVQGGTVTTFRVLPDAHRWGWVGFVLPAHGASLHLVTLAPYIVAVASILAVSLVAMRRWPLPCGLASWLLVPGFVLPFGELLYAWVPWLFGARNDLRLALGRPGPAAVGLLVLASLLWAVGGFQVQRRLYRGRALSPALWSCCVALALGASAVLLPALA